MTAIATTDVLVRNEGNVWLFHSLSPAALCWIEENVVVDSHLWCGSHAFCAEHRFGPELVTGLMDAGLTVKGG